MKNNLFQAAKNMFVTQNLKDILLTYSNGKFKFDRSKMTRIKRFFKSIGIS